jgi:maleate isomerase
MSLDYGTAGLVAILPPQANTTVEAELGVLLAPDVATIVSRLTCYQQDSRNRLIGYFRNVAASLRAFDSAKPDFGLFACTGSTYLVGLDEEDRAFAALPMPLISAARAVMQALDALGAKRLALVSPYPEWLTEACVAFWQAHGRNVVDVRMPEGDRSDTRRIYDLGSAQALAQIHALAGAAVDCILVTGTGMPSLGAIAKARSAPPVLSSNLCLAWAAHQRLGDEAPLQAWLAQDAPWRGRLALRFPKALQ